MLAVASGFAAGCGSDEGDLGQLDPEPVSVAEAISRPAELEKVRLSGVGIPLGRFGFLLTDGRRSIVVDAFGSEASKVDAGDHLTVTGKVERMSKPELSLVRRALSRDLGQRARSLLRSAPPKLAIGVGLVELETMSGEDTHGPQAGP